ncbi:MAG: hypothetical protein LUH03_08350, partial [Oscillospiraceae bacterium]|nr:hypothetical protein [Oscillospiraceae bacterium]
NQLRGKFLPVLGKISPVKEEVVIPGHEEREERLAAENVVPGYLDKKELQKIFVFDFCYDSRSNGYEQQMKRNLMRLSNNADNRNLDRAEKYAAGTLKKKIAAFKESIKREMEETLRTTQSEDVQSEKDILERYEQTFAQWEQRINKMRSDAEAQREQEYQEAVAFYEKKEYDKALALFQTIRLIDYRETNDYIDKARKAQEDERSKKAEEAARQKAQKEEEAVRQKALKKKRIKRISIIAVSSVAAVTAAAMLISQVIMPAVKYNQAETLYSYGDYGEAAILFDSLGDYSDAKSRSQDLWFDIMQRDTISCGLCYTVGIKTDGTVVATGRNTDGQCDVSDWESIVAISTGSFHTVGLKSDGTVIATGGNSSGQCDIADWNDIVAVSTGYRHTVGLKSDGTVVAVGSNSEGQCDVSDWE